MKTMDRIFSFKLTKYHLTSLKKEYYMRIYTPKIMRVPFPIMFLVLLLISCKEKTGTSAIDSDHALATFEVPPGFKIELVAAEPLISDPVDMEFDEYGNMYVVEMHGYPLDKSGSGNVILLKDTNGDGKMDERIIFADKLTLPAVLCAGKRVS